MKIYLDNCLFNRPFDEQSHIRIRIETEAKLAIQQRRLGCRFLATQKNNINPHKE
ncbi:MAG: hypothetical protein QX189_11830 [Methylococcales bacterium]